MAYDEQNIFARILRGELPAIKVYEDDQVLAFMDIMPQADGHTLVIPKQLSGAAAGQTVPHVHFHLIPSSVHELGKHALQMGDQEKIKAQAEKIRAAL